MFLENKQNINKKPQTFDQRLSAEAYQSFHFHLHRFFCSSSSHNCTPAIRSQIERARKIRWRRCT